MAKDTVITPEQIAAVKKRLRKLPVKNASKNREKAMELLATDFQKAIRKGYTLKDIQGFLAEEGLTIPAYLLKRQKAHEWKIPTRNTTTRDVTGDVKFPAQQIYGQTVQEQNIETAPIRTATRTSENIVESYGEKSAHIIIVKPDTPDTEL